MLDQMRVIHKSDDTPAVGQSANMYILVMRAALRMHETHVTKTSTVYDGV